MDTLFLLGASFLTSTLTGTIGLGGGVLLISIMASLRPPAAIVPVLGSWAETRLRGHVPERALRTTLITALHSG